MQCYHFQQFCETICELEDFLHLSTVNDNDIVIFISLPFFSILIFFIHGSIFKFSFGMFQVYINSQNSFGGINQRCGAEDLRNIDQGEKKNTFF